MTQMFKKSQQKVGIKFQFDDLVKNIISEKQEIEKTKQYKYKLERIKQYFKQRRQMMFALLINSRKNCQANAKIFSKEYLNFIQSFIRKEKTQFLRKRQSQFLKNSNRKKLQEYMQIEVYQCKYPQILYQYLKYPTKMIIKLYNQSVEKEIKKLDQQFYSTQKCCISEFESIIGAMTRRIKGCEHDLSNEHLFEDSFIRSKDDSELGSHMKDLFLELLTKGQTISSRYQNNKFKLKQGESIQCPSPLQHHINIKFTKSSLEFEILNLAYFLFYLQEQIQKIKKEVEQMTKFSFSQYQQFKHNTRLILCNAACPSCDKTCDVDMRIDPYHTIHRAESGHQLRALRGVIVQKMKGTTIEHYPSVIRCQDVPNSYAFEYYGRMYEWKEFVQQKKNQWSFQSKPKSKWLLQYLWNTCGQKICDQFAKDGKKMKYLPYSQQSIQFILSNQQDPTQYIFAIDGSGSMSGTPWKDQLNALRNVLIQISKDSAKHKVSILVFNHECHPYIIRTNPLYVDINAIQFPSGGTTLDPTFKKAAEIIREVLKTQPKSVYFFYISDGGASHPIQGIKQLLDCKQQIKAKKFNFNYTSILMGNDSYGKSCMQKINQEMGGRSEYIPNASNLSQKLKQILAK